MIALFACTLLQFYFLILFIPVKAKCPANFHFEIEGICYRINTDIPLRLNDARDNCPRMESQSRITSIKPGGEAMKRLQEFLIADIETRMQDALCWIGLYMNDKSMQKAAQDRTWVWAYDESEIIQKEYKSWNEEGGPTDTTKACTSINPSNDFLVEATSCRGTKLPVLCMMKEGKSCKHNYVNYLMYREYCVAYIPKAMESDKTYQACDPNAATAFKDEMQNDVIMAYKNGLIGGGVYMNMRRSGFDFFDLDDSSKPDADMWAKNEPREGDCAVLFLELPENDGDEVKLKLRSMNCDFPATSVCAMPGGSYKATVINRIVDTVTDLIENFILLVDSHTILIFFNLLIEQMGGSHVHVNSLKYELDSTFLTEMFTAFSNVRLL